MTLAYVETKFELSKGTSVKASYASDHKLRQFIIKSLTNASKVVTEGFKFEKNLFCQSYFQFK